MLGHAQRRGPACGRRRVCSRRAPVQLDLLGRALIPLAEFRPAAGVSAALAGLGRSEDLRFSPDNHLLAIAGFVRGHCLLIRVEVTRAADRPVVYGSDFLQLTSTGITSAHGLDFIDDQTIVVANRHAGVEIIPLPAGELAGRRCEAAPVRRIRGHPLFPVRTPGSLVVVPRADDRSELLVCNNYRHRVSRHLLGRTPGFRARGNRVLIRRGVNIPDGIAVSPDGSWLAVSSHRTRDVKLYARSRWLGPWTKPAGILRGLAYPHGLRFTPDGSHLLAADAGSPYVFVFAAGSDWRGTREPIRAVAVLDAETFSRGHATPQEGGPKGIDIDRTGTVVAITCEEVPLAFFPLSAFVQG